MLPNQGPGRLIAVEGLDGAGTTTQVQMLYRRLGASVGVHVTHEPSEGPIGLLIRTVLAHRVQVDDATLAALFAADRMDHLYRAGADGIAGHLHEGTHVLTDRYYLSSLAYQGITLDWQWIWNLHAHCIRPDVILFIDVPVEVCLQRIAAGRGGQIDLFENADALTQARARYLEAIHRLRESGEEIAVVNGEASPAQVHAAVWQIVAPLLPSRSTPDGAPLRSRGD